MLIFALLIAQVASQCLVQCAKLHREGCPQTPDAVCGSCFLNYTGSLSGNTNCTAILPCVAAQTCRGHGVCRSDQSCGCDPDWYGADCSQPINAGSWSDVNLAGVIIAWLLMVPVLIVLTICCIKAHQDGKFEDWKDQFVERLPPMPSFEKKPASTEMTPANRPTESSALVGGAKASGRSAPRATSKRALEAGAGGTALDDVPPEAESYVWDEEPENMAELVNYIQEIAPGVSTEAAKIELKKHNYNAAEAVLKFLR